MITSNRRRGYAIDLDGSSEYASVTPALKLTGQLSLSDDFSDGNYNGWTVASGAYSVDNAVANPLSTNQYSLVCNTAGIISIPCNQAYGSWEFDLYKGADANSWLGHILSTSGTSGTAGYMVYVTSTEIFTLYRTTTGAYLFDTAPSYISNTTWYRIKITRNTNGQFYTYIKGGAFGSDYVLVSVTGGSGTNPVTDNTYTSSNYFVLDLDANDRIANIQCEYGEGSLDLNGYEMVKHSDNRGFEATGALTWTGNGNHSIAQSSTDKKTGTYSMAITSTGIGSELISNTSFETDTTGWSAYGSDDSIQRWTDDKYAGSASLYVASTGGATGAYTSITTAIGTTYNFTVYKKVTAGNTRPFSLYKADSSDFATNQVVSATDTNSGSWSQISLSFTATATTTYLMVYLSSGGSGDREFWVDSCSCKGNETGDATTNYVSLASDKRVDVEAGKKYTLEMWARGTGVLGSDLMTGYNFTSGWALLSGSRTSNSITDGSIIKYGALEKGKTYKIRIAGSVGTSLFITSGSTTTGAYTLTGTFDDTRYLMWSTPQGDNHLLFSAVGTATISTFTIQEVTLPTITLALGSQTKSVTNISCVPGTFTKLVWNFQATVNEVGQPLKMYVNQADVTYVDDVSLTQAYDALVSGWVKVATIANKYWMGKYSSLQGILFRLSTFGGGSLATEFYDGISTSVNSPINITTGVWYLYQTIINRTSVATSYLNGGSPQQNTISTLGKLNVSADFTIGIGAGAYFNGNIGEVQIVRFNDITTSNVNASTLLSAYYNGLPSSWAGGNPQVVANYKFRGDTNTLLLDDNSISSNDLTGTNVTIADQTNGIYPRR